MKTREDQTEWIDGFLFVGNHLALNFLNTKPVLDDGPHEFLSDPNAFARWLVAAGVASPARAKAIMRACGNSLNAGQFIEDVRGFRERLRAAVVKIECGSLPPDSFLKEVNQLLDKYPRRSLLVKESQSLVRKYPFELNTPQDLWAFLAEAVASLLGDCDHTRMRKCESCIVHFLDTSKKGSRRWCSMNICGNKVKVAAYQQRKRKTRRRSQ